MIFKIKKNIKFFSLFFIFVIIIFHQTNFFNKFYIILTHNYEQRIEKIHGNCFKIGAGFLKTVSNKYKLKPKIYSYIPIPSSYWLFDDKNSSGEVNEKYIALLNYSKEIYYTFQKVENNLFINSNKYDSEIIKGPKNIKIFFNKTIFYPIIIEIFFEDFSQSANYQNYKINLKKVYTINLNKSNSNIYKNYILYEFKKNKTDFGTRNKNIYIKINKIKNISKIKLELNNKFDLDEFKILYQKENCYLLTK